MEHKEESQKIVDHFFDKGFSVSKRDYDMVNEILNQVATKAREEGYNKGWGEGYEKGYKTSAEMA